MTHEEFAQAAQHWQNRDAAGRKMERGALLEAAQAFLAARRTCALATASGEFVRCTPLEYGWHDGALWIFSEGGQKFAALEHNRNVCVAVFDGYDGMGSLNGMQITGTAEIAAPFGAEYLRAAACKNIPVEALRKLPFVMNLIKITPQKMELLCSDFRRQGFDSRQTLVLGGDAAGGEAR